MSPDSRYTEEEFEKFYSRRESYVKDKSQKFFVEKSRTRPLKVFLTKEARKDETDYYEHFKDNGSSLHNAFVERLGLYYYELSDNPFKHDFIDSQNILRDLTSPRWPFVIIFEVIGDTLIIYTIHHHKSK